MVLKKLVFSEKQEAAIKLVMKGRETASGACSAFILDAGGDPQFVRFTEVLEADGKSQWDDAVEVAVTDIDKMLYAQYANGNLDPTSEKLRELFDRAGLLSEADKQELRARHRVYVQQRLADDSARSEIGGGLEHSFEDR